MLLFDVKIKVPWDSTGGGLEGELVDVERSSRGDIVIVVVEEVMLASFIEGAVDVVVEQLSLPTCVKLSFRVWSLWNDSNGNKSQSYTLILSKISRISTMKFIDDSPATRTPTATIAAKANATKLQTRRFFHPPPLRLSFVTYNFSLLLLNKQRERRRTSTSLFYFKSSLSLKSSGITMKLSMSMNLSI